MNRDSQPDIRKASSRGRIPTKYSHRLYRFLYSTPGALFVTFVFPWVVIAVIGLLVWALLPK